MVVIDGHISYIGGINFSDHNFEWHDLMLKIDDRDVAAFMQRDFDNTWAGRDVFSRSEFDGMSISLIDGRSNEDSFAEIFDLIGAARKSIFIESPYLSWPFYDHLRSAIERGVVVKVLMPDANNRSWVQRYTEWEAARSGIHLHNYVPKMTHLKAMLIDEEVLVVGSSNFDYYSYRTQQEVVALVRNPDLVREFIVRVRDADLKQSKPADASVVKKSTVLLYGFIRAMGKLTVTLAKI
jgi:cardiolipin synthase